MGRPRKIVFPKDEPKKPSDAEPAADTKLPPKKRRFKRGGVRTGQRLRRAMLGPHPVARAVMMRLIRDEVGNEFRWSRSAIDLIIEQLNAHVHRTLTITKATMTHAGKKTLTADQLKFGARLAEGLV